MRTGERDCTFGPDVSQMAVPGSLDRFFVRVYERFRPNYVHLLIAIVAVFIQVLVIPAYAALLRPIYDATWSEQLRVFLWFEVWLGTLGAAGMFVIARRRHQSAIRWLRDDSAIDVRDVWTSAVLDFPRTVLLLVGWYALCCLPPAIYTGILLDFSLVTELLYIVGLGCLIAGAGVFIFLFFETALRPVVLRELAEELPASWIPPRPGLLLRRKLLIFLPAINLFNAMAVGAASTNDLDRDSRLAVIVLTALGLSGTLALAMNLMLRNSMLAPLDRLRTALQAVAGGDLRIQVPPMGGDELDEITAAFNDMTHRLAAAEEEMRASRARIVVAADTERRRMERDLHDGAQQHFVLLQLKLGLLERQVDDGDPELSAKLDELKADLRAGLQELRDLAHGIYPSVLENDGLAAALSETAQRAAIPTEVRPSGVTRYDRDVESAVYFCCREALQNASKHAGDGATAKITLAENEGVLRFEVADSGAGFDVGRTDAHGLQNMRDRIGALGGELHIDSAPQRGTCVTGRIRVGA